jgi:hypothetical protein
MNQTLARIVCGFLIMVLSGAVEPLVAQESSAPQSSGQVQNPPQPPIELPDSPGRSTTQQAPAAQPPQEQTGAPQNGPTPQSSGPQPSGTAAAPSVQVTGGAASQPAGVAIAPPKQRQIRSLLIKLGFLAGAGVALGTVAALTAASPSRVPGSPGH